MTPVELVAPAGAMEMVVAALDFGADAVYFGPRAFSLRSGAEDFSGEGLKRAVGYVKGRNRKVYLTLNALQNNRDLGPVHNFIRGIEGLGVDGVILSDPGLIEAVKAVKIPIHISTQACVMNREAALFWKDKSASRIILARELSLEEVREICGSADLDFEIFIHGALCVSYSGRCMLSDYLAGRSGNKGECVQACRWGFSVAEQREKGAFPIEEENNKTFILNSKDLCALPLLKEILSSGVRALKIEGRNKGVHYVSVVTHVYREAMDAFYAEGERFRVREQWMADLCSVSHRAYTTGFLKDLEYHRPLQVCGSPGYERGFVIVGVVKEALPGNRAVVDTKNDFNIGSKVNLFSPERGPYLENSRVLSMESISGAQESLVHTNRVVIMEFEDRASAGSLVRTGPHP
jgi:putative protease